MSVTRIICTGCGFPQVYCKCHKHIDARIADAEDELVKLHCEKEGKAVYITVTATEEER